MLAHLLRRTLLAQLLLGAALAYSVWGNLVHHGGAVLVLALVFPFLSTALAIGFTAVVARPGAGTRAWWRACLGEIGASWRIFLLRQPWTWATPALQAAAVDAPQRMPVVLVHGYLCNHRLWDDVAASLRSQGHAVQAVNLEPVFTSIDDYSPVITQAVAQLRAHTGAAQVVLVGHSMGGLAIRAWLRQHGTAQVARVFTLGTPHAGTQVPQPLSTPNGRQMRWHSPWLAALQTQEDDTVRGLFEIALTTHDNIVFPQQAQVLAGVPVQVFTGIGHLQMCLHRPVIDWLATRLRTLPSRTD